MSENTRESTAHLPIHRKIFARIWGALAISSEETDRVDLSQSVWVPGNAGPSGSDLSDILDEDYWTDFDATVEELARETE